jgi:tetratricopeptide (TPR) repeat protein
VTKHRDSWALLAQTLIHEGRFEDAVQTFQGLFSRIRGFDDLATMLNLSEQIPSHLRSNDPFIATTHAEVLSRNHAYETLLTFTAEVIDKFDEEDQAKILFARATGLYSIRDYTGACDALKKSLPFLSGESRGRALGRLGLTLFQLDEPWEFAFVEARNCLTGRNLGLQYLNYGYCLYHCAQFFEAQAVWTEALSLLKRDPYSLAWLHYNLGSSFLRNLEIVEAERHFLEGERLSGNSKSFSMRSSILSGLATVRKARGEWSRAEFTYREAFRVATDSFDRVFALTGLVRTFLLAGHATKANETLELELNAEDANDPNIQIVRALIYLHLGDSARAKRALEAITIPVVGTYQWLERIARAELARRDGHLEQAVQLLEGLPVHTLHAREEVRQWPHLFQLIEAAGQPVPLPLEYVQGMTVRVAALGVLRVTVNDRGVPIVPTGRVGELLVFLLEHGGAASLEVISEALYPEATHERARKSVWMLVKFLRTALGWDGAVIALRAAYQLDPNVTWQYDVREVRTQGTVQGGVQTDFLAGVYSEWALEVGRELGKLTDSAVSIIN